MGKASMCLKMLELLNTGQVYKCSELADLLETNSRNIIEYKKELEETGYYITSIPGKYGGYQLEKSVLMPSLKLTEKEKNALAVGSIYLEKRDEFPLKSDYQVAVSKIFSTISHKRLDDDFLIINSKKNICQKQLEEWYKILVNAIKNRYVLDVIYLNNKNKKIELMFHPYELFMKDDLLYILGWDESINDITYIDFNRLIELKSSSKKFIKWKYYNRSNYIDEFGIKSDDKWHHLVLKISNNMLFKVKDFTYGKNQVISSSNSKNSLVELDMQNKDEILNFVLGFGRDLEVLEPDWLKKEIKNVIEYLKKIYG